MARQTDIVPKLYAEQVVAAVNDSGRSALEGLAVEGYRTRRLSEAEVRRMLGFRTRMQVHALLAEHHVDLNYSAEHVEEDIAASDRFLEQRAAQAARSR